MHTWKYELTTDKEMTSGLMHSIGTWTFQAIISNFLPMIRFSTFIQSKVKNDARIESKMDKSRVVHANSTLSKILLELLS
jgi:hypothetical protein